VTTPINRAKGMGMIGAAFGLGFIIGPAIGGILAGPDPVNADYQSPAFAAAGLSAVALALGIVFLKESLSQEIRDRLNARTNQGRLTLFRRSLDFPSLRFLILMSFLATVAFAGLEATFAMWSRRQFGWGPEQNGYVFAFIGILGALVQGGLVGPLVKRLGETRLIIQGAGALCLGVLLIPFAETLPVLIIAMTVAGYGFSIISPALNSAISLRVDEEHQGMVMGVTRSATTLARVVGPALAGLLFAGMGKDWPYYAGAVSMATVMVLVWLRRTELCDTEQRAANNTNEP